MYKSNIHTPRLTQIPNTLNDEEWGHFIDTEEEYMYISLRKINPPLYINKIPRYIEHINKPYLNFRNINANKSRENKNLEVAKLPELPELPKLAYLSSQRLKFWKHKNIYTSSDIKEPNEKIEESQESEIAEISININEENLESNSINLHLCTFKTPPLGAVMREQGDADCALKKREGVKIQKKVEKKKSLSNKKKIWKFVWKAFVSTSYVVSLVLTFIVFYV